MAKPSVIFIGAGRRGYSDPGIRKNMPPCYCAAGMVKCLTHRLK